MIKVLHTIDTPGPGGAETVFVNLIERLDKKVFKPVIVVCGVGWVHDELKRLGYEPYILPVKGSFNLRYLLGLMRIILHEKVDVIQSHLLGSNVYCSLAGFVTRKPVVATFHGAVDFADEQYLYQKFQIINALSKKIVVVSGRLRQQLLESASLDECKMVTIYNGVDTCRFSLKDKVQRRNALGFSGDDIIVGSVGNVRPPKGYDVLIEAAAKVVSARSNVKFVIAGENDNDLYIKLLSQRDALGLQKSVIFLGFRSDVDVLMNSLDIFLLSSTSEGFSISTIEAMACGLPVVVTKSGGPQEIVTEGKDGCLVEVGSADAIASALMRLIEDKEFREALSIRAQQTVRDRFIIDVMLDAYSRLYMQVTGKG